jgi:hypothetical protein
MIMFGKTVLIVFLILINNFQLKKFSFIQKSLSISLNIILSILFKLPEDIFNLNLKS